MAFEYSFENLKFSNAFNRKSEADYEYDELKIKGDCKITNYDPNTSDGKKKGLITIDFSKNYTTIKSGLGDKLSTNHSVADFSNKKYSPLSSFILCNSSICLVVFFLSFCK